MARITHIIESESRSERANLENQLIIYSAMVSSGQIESYEYDNTGGEFELGKLVIYYESSLPREE